MRVLREQVVAQANLLEALTTHPTLVGTGRERAVIDMLRGQIPRRYEVLSGTVLGQDDEGSWQKENRQLDVMVVDTFDYPTLLRNGDIAVVLPQAVRVVIEVKSDLCSPPDPDKEPAQARDDPAPKETFLDAIKQVSRNRSLFGETPILTVLLSHKYPAGNATLRAWLDLVGRTRRKLHEKLGSLEEGSRAHSSTEYEAHRLDADLLPDVIIADRGAIATREGSKYNFFIAANAEAKENAAPGLVTLVSHVIKHLHLGDPVLQVMRLDPKYKSLGSLREDAHALFSKVMAPGLESDDNNPPLEFVRPPPEPTKKRSLLRGAADDDVLPEENHRSPHPPGSSPKGGT